MDSLVEVIRAAWDENGEVPFPLYDREVDQLATAVRTWLVSEENVERGRLAILEDLRDRRLLKYLFAEEPDNCAAYGYVESPIDTETQNECAESLARAALASLCQDDRNGS